MVEQEYICPNCKNPIYDQEALLCHFCGESLKRSSKGALGKVRYSHTVVWIAIVLIVILGFVCLMVL